MRSWEVLTLIGLVLLLCELVLIARILVDLVGALARPDASYGTALGSAQRVIYQITEPVLAPVRRVVKPVQLGGVMLDLSVMVVFIAILVLRQVIFAL
jgi:YggT family protein